MMPEEVMTLLKSGNARFVSANSAHPRQSRTRLQALAEHGHHPVATILCSSDSRVPPEILFDQGLGDLFVVRVAGAVVDVDQAASIEYGVDQLGTPLLVILGNADCAAVRAVLEESALPGNLPRLLDNMVPAVEEAIKRFPELSGEELLPFAVQANVQQSSSDLLEISPLTKQRVMDGLLKIVGAVYDVRSGSIQWMAPDPQLVRLTPKPKPRPTLKPVESAPMPIMIPVSARPSESVTPAVPLGPIIPAEPTDLLPTPPVEDGQGGF